MKKLTAFLTALALAFSASLAAFAQEYTEGYLHYTISDESITITGYFGDEETVTVPAMIAGIPVNAIAAGAFSGSGITELNLPDTITDIENGAVDAGVTIHYNSNLPSGGEPQPTQPQPQPSRPASSPDWEDDEEEDDEPESENRRPKKDKTQTTKPAEPSESQPQPAQSAQSQPIQQTAPASGAPTAPASAIEEAEIVLEPEKAEPAPAEEQPAPAPESPSLEPAQSAETAPLGAILAAALAAAALALGGVLLWKKKQ